MPEESGNADVPVTKQPEPEKVAAGAAPAPVPATAKPEPAPAAPAVPPEADPNQVFEVDIGGKYVQKTLGELAEDARKLAAEPKLSEDDLKQFELYKNAVSGDANATRTLIEQQLPPVEKEIAPDSIEGKLVAATERIEQLEGRVNESVSVTDQITDMRNEARIRQIIETNKEKLPYLAKNPEGAKAVVMGFKNAISGLASPLGSQQAQVALQQVMLQAEGGLKSMAELYSGFTPGTVNSPKSSGAPSVVDDQPTATATPGMIPAALQIGPDGFMVDSRGRPVKQNVSGTVDMVPDVPISVPSGGAPPVSEPSTQRGPVTLEQARAIARQRAQELRNAE